MVVALVLTGGRALGAASGARGFDFESHQGISCSRWVRNFGCLYCCFLGESHADKSVYCWVGRCGFVSSGTGSWKLLLWTHGENLLDGWRIVVDVPSGMLILGGFVSWGLDGVRGVCLAVCR